MVKNFFFVGLARSRQWDQKNPTGTNGPFVNLRVIQIGPLVEGGRGDLRGLAPFVVTDTGLSICFAENLYPGLCRNYFSEKFSLNG
jgi:hypothetical protein